MFHMYRCTVILILLSSTGNYGICHPIKCSYQNPKIDEVELGVILDDSRSSDDNEDSSRIVRKRSAYSNLRIKPYFDSSVNRLPFPERSFVKDSLLPDAVGFWARALRVKRPALVPIRLNRKCKNSQYYWHKYDKRQSCAGSCRVETKCGEVSVPEEHLLQCRYCVTADPGSCGVSGAEDGPGVPNTDFLLYVSSVESERCSNADTVAYAAHCQQEAAMDRPIAGHVNLCPGAVSVAPRDQEVLISTVKHEILHALGFSAGLYAFFRDADTGLPLTERNDHGRPKKLNREKGYYQWSEKTVRTLVRKDWWTRTGKMNHSVNVMVTPRVQAEVRYHFGCSEMEGAELENQGSEGTALTHWEKRLFENEAMTGTHTQNPVYSRVTLAMMEDTGWYKPNYGISEQLHWGRSLGCDFAMKSCGEWIKMRRRRNLSIEPYCDRLKRLGESSGATTTCTVTRDSVALCNLVEYDAILPREYQNFDSLNFVGKNDLMRFGGSVELADFCPYNQEFEWKNDTLSPGRRDSRCEFEDNTPIGTQNAALETYGLKSRCFYHYHKWAQRKCGYVRTFKHYGAGCYEFHCVDGRLWLDLLNGSRIYPCYHEGQHIVIRRIESGWLHEGIVLCPSCPEMCQHRGSSFRCLPESKPPRPVIDPVIPEPCVASRTAFLRLWQLLILYWSFFVGFTMSYKTQTDFDQRFPKGTPVEKIDNTTLNKFIMDHFSPPGTELEKCKSEDWKKNPKKLESIADKNYRKWAHELNNIWSLLCKQMNPSVQENPELYSLIYVPHPFIAPGGRFREFYYWDTYWIIRGLLISEMYNTTANMIRNLASMVSRYGFVPNGGRVYYLRRSQPPFLIPMVYEYYTATRDKAFIKELLPILETELNFWKNNRRITVADRSGTRHHVYQYNTPSNVPRPESYRQDVKTAEVVPNSGDKQEMWRDIASAAESGWDFSSRWFGDGHSLSTIRTRKIVPIDLNAIICWNMDILQFLYEQIGNHAKSKQIESERELFRRSVTSLFYNATLGAWFDWDLESNSQNTNFFPSVAVPLFTGCYQLLNTFTPTRLFRYLNDALALSYPGGVPTSTTPTEEQWDFPNGWPPLNHMIIEGLRKSNNPVMQEAAFQLAEKWIRGNYKVYIATGSMFEKYDVTVCDMKPGSGGEYDVQTGFGWTNGVVLDLLYAYGPRLTSGTNTVSLSFCLLSSCFVIFARIIW